MAARLSTHKYGRHMKQIARPESWDYTECPGCPAIFIGGTDESQSLRWTAHAESGHCPGLVLLPEL